MCVNGEQYDLSGTTTEPIERSQNLTAKRSARTNMCPMMDPSTSDAVAILKLKYNLFWQCGFWINLLKQEKFKPYPQPNHE